MQQAMTLSRQNQFHYEEALCYQILASLYFYNWKRTDSSDPVHQTRAHAGRKNPTDRFKLFDDTFADLLLWPIESGGEKAITGMPGWNYIGKTKSILLQAEELNYSNSITYAFYKIQSLDTARFFTEKAIAWARSKNDKKYEALFLKAQAQKYYQLGQVPLALNSYLQALEIKPKPG